VRPLEHPTTHSVSAHASCYFTLSAEIQRQKSSRSRDSASARAAAPADDESSAASEEDDYKEERLPTGVKRQRRPRARRIGEEEGAERAVRKRKRRERETENLDDLTPEQSTFSLVVL
jgi:hypothetical protein